MIDIPTQVVRQNVSYKYHDYIQVVYQVTHLKINDVTAYLFVIIDQNQFNITLFETNCLWNCIWGCVGNRASNSLGPKMRLVWIQFVEATFKIGWIFVITWFKQ